MSLTFSGGEDGLTVVDAVQRHQCTLATDGAASPDPVSTDALAYPVEAAVSVTAERLALPNSVGVYVHGPGGEVLAETSGVPPRRFERDRYTLELTTEVKTYLAVEAAVEVSAEGDNTYVAFDAPTAVVVGALSRRDRPAGTITTTGDPEDVMAAVSHFGSALQVTGPERSYPSLRGHPPLVELGDELHVPDHLEPPDTGVTLELPADLRHVLVAAPLASYLGAEVVPGAEPRLVTDAGFARSLDGPLGYETTVERTLKQVFFLDCVTRNEGVYDVALHERDAVEERVDLDFAALYERSLAEQVAAYLSVPFDDVADSLPGWKLTTHLDPSLEGVELLPFLVNDLAVIRSADSGADAVAAEEAAAVDEFLREGEFTRSASGDGGSVAAVDPPSTESLEEAWVGEGAPAGASKPTAQGHRNRLGREPTDGEIDITLVCNDASMAAERDMVREVYGSREDLALDVSVHRSLTVAELRSVLTEDAAFLHYVGHIDEGGFECADGRLDARDLDVIGVDAFFLNACTSYEQGMALVEAGSVGGVVTMRAVVNSGAVAVGGTLARLLNRGFPLRAALDIARDESVVGNTYTVVGDGGLAIAQAESGTPLLVEVTPAGEEFAVELVGYPTAERGMGSIFKPYLADADGYYLNSGRITETVLDRSELRTFLAREEMPVRVDGNLRWGDVDLASR